VCENGGDGVNGVNCSIGHKLFYKNVTKMPWAERKVKGGKMAVFNRDTGRVTAKHTTKAKADAQMRLLRAVKHGWKPTGK
jgi:hypothetical protein